MTQEALKELLEAVEAAIQAGDWKVDGACDPDLVIRRAKEALAQPEQEPVAFEEWLSNQHGDPEEIGFLQALRIAYTSGQDSITAPPQRKPLSDEEIKNIVREVSKGSALRPMNAEPTSVRIARAIEAAHGIKGEA